MPIIYLSPSTQEYNEYVNGLGNEEEWMNRLADAMEPMLFASGIQYTRNTPDMTAASSIRASNAGNYNLHLALHTNASGEDQAGQNRGIIAFYFPGSARGMRAAQFLADGLKASPFCPDSYPLPGEVRAELGALDVYSRPDYDTPPIAQLYDGAQVTVINEYYGWYLIQFGDQVGYVAADFVAVE